MIQDVSLNMAILLLKPLGYVDNIPLEGHHTFDLFSLSFDLVDIVRTKVSTFHKTNSSAYRPYKISKTLTSGYL